MTRRERREAEARAAAATTQAAVPSYRPATGLGTMEAPVAATRQPDASGAARGRHVDPARSSDTVTVGGITFSGPAPLSPVLGTPAVPYALPKAAPAAPRLAEQDGAPHAPDAAPAQRPTTPPAAATDAPVDEPADQPAPPRPAGAPLPSRRELRERADKPARATRRRDGDGAGTPPALRRGARWVPRAAVLGTLAAATIAAPFATGHASQGTGTPVEGDAMASGPSTLEIVRQNVAPPATSEGIAAAPQVAARADVAASRSQEREPLPDCDTSVRVTSENGNLSGAELCDLWQAGERLQPRAADALTALNQAFRAEFGRDILLIDTYRSLDRQYSVKASRGSFAAQPGTSMHGWGLAIDLSSQVTGNSEYYRWLLENGPAYGWENPPWAQRGGSGSYEPWHFEYRPGVEEISTWH
jgi:hypothetical protein